MSVRHTMRFRVTFQRRSEGKDVYGHPDGGWEDRDPIPCYAYTDAPSRMVTAVDAVTAGMSVRIWVPQGADVVATDRVLFVKDRLGMIVYGRLDIDGVNRRTSYTEIICRRAE